MPSHLLGNTHGHAYPADKMLSKTALTRPSTLGGTFADYSGARQVVKKRHRKRGRAHHKRQIELELLELSHYRHILRWDHPEP